MVRPTDRNHAGVNGPTRSRDKSAKYPFYSLGTCLEFVRRVDRLGSKVAESSVIEDLGLQSRYTKSYSYKLSSSIQFGLLEYKNSQLAVTNLAMRIIHPTEEAASKEAISTALQSPPLYQKLIARFADKTIPKVETLGNILLNEFAIAKNVRLDAAKAFADSARWTGVLREDGVLRMGTPTVGSEDTAASASAVLSGTTTRGTAPHPDTQTVELSFAEGRRASIIVPADMQRNEAERLKRLLDLLVLEGE